MIGYIIKRIAYLVVTLFAISIISFIVIQLPPGDYLSTYVRNRQAQGDQVDPAEIEALKQIYGLDQPAYMQYLKWITRLVFHGRLGISFRETRSARDVIGERIGYTVMISLFTTVFVYAAAIPLGIYSAMHQYSFLDYLVTFLGIGGATVPNFLLALVFMYLGMKYFGTNVGGLYSPKYELAPWSWGKVLDLLSNLWLPVVVIGLGGTARITRVMRATVLDELGKDYVTTARAKGVPERQLVLKYPVRVAISPVLAGIGGVLPALISGSTIVSIVLNLPTTGPMLNSALLMQDMYLAASFIMILSALAVVGTLISDLLLAWADPRIRLQ
jgi:peptide/nickel transport system permease protein